jgi:hypothetical protein
MAKYVKKSIEENLSKENTLQKSSYFVGRPKKFTYNFCEGEIDFFLQYLEGRTTDPTHFTKKGWHKGTQVLFIAELCHLRGYSHQRWSDRIKKFMEKKEFVDAVANVEETLELRIAKGMTTGSLNSRGASLTLQNKHGWRTKTDVVSKTEVTATDILAAIDQKFKDIN